MHRCPNIRPHNALLHIKEQIVYTGYFMESAQSTVFTRKILETKYGIWEGDEKVRDAGF